MPRISVPVDQQIQEFEETLRTHLGTNLPASINIDYWAEFDEIDNASFEQIDRVIQIPFDHLETVYQGTRVARVLLACSSLMKHAARISLNIPWHIVAHFGGEFFERITSNLMDFYVRIIYAQLRTEMIMVNHSAHMIQRNWCKVVNDPSYMMCRRRLMHDFLEFKNELETHVSKVHRNAVVSAHQDSGRDVHTSADAPQDYSP